MSSVQHLGNVEGLIRVTQAYLRVLGHYGNPNVIRGVDVVTGHWDSPTQQAAQQFLQSHPEIRGAEWGRFNIALLEATRKKAEAIAHPMPATNANDFYRILAQTPVGKSESIDHLHPLMRHPLQEAIAALKKQGVSVVLRDDTRSTHLQEKLVAKGNSVAPPGWSFHDYGLAVDVYPRKENGQPEFNTHDPRWKTIIRTFQQYGFYSLYADQHWDMPHFELPMKTADLVHLPVDRQGWKQIPNSATPSQWQQINCRAAKPTALNHCYC